MRALYKVLIVDDEMLIRQGIINYIDWEREGFQIAGEASNGKEALRMIEKLEPHILITDIVMPDLDGTELVKLAKAKYPEMEIIVLSSFENFDYVRSTFQNGVADYILKPKLNGEELIKTLRRIAPATRGTTKKTVSLEELLEKRIQGYALPSHEEQMLKDFPYEQFFLAGICWVDDDKEGQVLESFMNLGSDKKSLLLPENESDFRVMLINFPAEQQLSVKQDLINLTNEHRDSGLTITLLISMPFSLIDELKSVYENSLMKLHNYMFYLSGETVLIDGELPEPEKASPFRLSQFIELFKQKKFDTAIASLEKHVEQLTRDYTQDIFEFKSWLENIIFNVIVLLGNMKYNVEELEQAKYQYFADINEAKDAKSAITQFDDFLGAVQSLLAIHTNVD
ncbi:response regulator [Sediminibacillus halophilus]|uniref:response regulator n=1 Tax=Sediminibacillus halophilus TaxID=482461 RepID=UPI0009F269ED|nr:response regulator [Sediminibacillus halophilus]